MHLVPHAKVILASSSSSSWLYYDARFIESYYLYAGWSRKFVNKALTILLLLILFLKKVQG